MCYTVQTQVKSELATAKKKGNTELAERLERILETVTSQYVASGFAHPKIPVLCGAPEPHFKEAHWGLIPHWAKDKADAHQIWNKTINARGETIHEKPAFRDAAKNARCAIPVAGFYEYHHYQGKTFPYYVYRQDGDIMWLAGLYNEWVDKSTGEILPSFSIVTCKGNDLLAKIHNNPKLKEPRIPVILDNDSITNWVTQELAEASALLQSIDSRLLKAHTVPKLKGKESPGDVPEACQLHDYKLQGVLPVLTFENLNQDPTPTLF